MDNSTTLHSNKKRKDYTFMIIVFISFILSLPFDIFIIRADWEKPNSIELLQEKNPAGYERWCERNAKDGVDWSPSLSDYSTPIHAISFFLGIPFYGALLSIYYIIYFTIQLFLSLPYVLKLIIKFIVYLFAMINIINMFERIINKIKEKRKSNAQFTRRTTN